MTFRTGKSKDIYDYNGMLKTGNVACTGANVFSTVLNVTGRGVLHKALIQTTTSYFRDIRITIDGIVVFWSSGAGASTILGINREDFFFMANDASSQRLATRFGRFLGLFANAADLVEEGVFPLNTKQTGTATKGVFFPISKGIRFNNSLLIEVCANNATDQLPVNILYDLG